MSLQANKSLFPFIENKTCFWADFRLLNKFKCISIEQELFDLKRAFLYLNVYMHWFEHLVSIKISHHI